ncbi:MAG: aldehyde ferredoxin oxidoreductase C-terminal domain-containing protein, partial [Promethearchaeota archaeon]
GAAIYKRPGLEKDHDYGDVFESREKLRLSYELQVLIGALDMLGACYFIGPSKDSLQKIAGLLKAKYGWDGDWKVLFEKSREMIRKELEFNEKAGIDKKQNTLPDFFKKEPAIPSGYTWDYEDEDLIHFWDNRLN